MPCIYSPFKNGRMYRGGKRPTVERLLASTLIQTPRKHWGHLVKLWDPRRYMFIIQCTKVISNIFPSLRLKAKTWVYGLSAPDSSLVSIFLAGMFETLFLIHTRLVFVNCGSTRRPTTTLRRSFRPLMLENTRISTFIINCPLTSKCCCVLDKFHLTSQEKKF